MEVVSITESMVNDSQLMCPNHVSLIGVFRPALSGMCSFFRFCAQYRRFWCALATWNENQLSLRSVPAACYRFSHLFLPSCSCYVCQVA
eukprot:m.53251 g.53251  ORF g.53251 m.53251 type:complete len:89 (+) comp34242_c0_seq15:995-1261(+)